MEKYLERGDLINGRFAEATAIIGDRRVTLFHLKNITASVEIERTSIPRLGVATDLSIGGSARGTFEGELYRVTPEFREVLIKYMKTREETPMDFILTQNDPNHSHGSETVILKRCYLNGGEIAKINIEENQLNETISGTFEDVEQA